jgi:hypothetical protein
VGIGVFVAVAVGKGVLEGFGVPVGITMLLDVIVGNIVLVGVAAGEVLQLTRTTIMNTKTPEAIFLSFIASPVSLIAAKMPCWC